ncbi:MAG: two-CW domain-containing protein [Promethearchaeota archaeon]
MTKINCWEFKKCAREPGGAKVDELGVCPAAIETRTNAINGGKNAGRICWSVVGTLCGGTVQGTFVNKYINCLECDFYKYVSREEGENLKMYYSLTSSNVY